MGMKDDLEQEVETIFSTSWTRREGRKVPEASDVALGNDAVLIDATVLYADLSGSTAMVDGHVDWFAADVYKSYLHCAAKIIRSQGGEITAYDGDRVMAVFIGDSKNSAAARAALKINYAVQEIINPVIARRFTDTQYRVKQTVGIDTSKLFVARTGIRGANDLVWVGRSANYAAKLTTLSADYPTWITGLVYDDLSQDTKYSNGQNMWEKRTWTDMNGITVYRSTYRWSV